MSNKNWTGERLETFIHSRDAVDHLHRYALACEYVAGKTVLDIACGEGYGSHIMSGNATAVFGVDIDIATIRKARLKYVKENLEFKEGSTDAIPFEDAMFDVVVSFETIEHHDKHELMLSEIKRVLKPGGLMILSTPDKLYYSDKRNFVNKFHIKELYKADFSELVLAHFKNVQMLNQRFINGNSVIQDDKIDSVAIYSGNYNEVGRKDVNPFYLVAIASDEFFNPGKTSIFDGTEITLIETKHNNNLIYNSTTYKTGKRILSPLFFLKKMFR